MSADNVAMDCSKVQAVVDWPIPKSVRALRGFLGFAGYYRIFIQNLGTIATPLRKLLKEGYCWSMEADTAF